MWACDCGAYGIWRDVVVGDRTVDNWLVTAWFGSGSTCDCDGSLTGCLLKNNGDIYTINTPFYFAIWLSFLWFYVLNDIQDQHVNMVGYVLCLCHIHINEIQDQQVNIVEYLSYLCRIHINKIQDQQVNTVGYVSCLCRIHINEIQDQQVNTIRYVSCRVYVVFI